jgi:hypothetical protein
MFRAVDKIGLRWRHFVANLPYIELAAQPNWNNSKIFAAY